MATFSIALGSLVLYIVAYHTYGRWLARKLFKLDPNAPVPSQTINDGRDYVPTPKQILFGHHFTSIAGTGPIVGPALAVIWGWLPALLWVIFGSIFMGAVHDLATLVVSIRNRGQTVGEIAGRLINPRVKALFLIILFLALMIVLAIFGLVIANIFDMYPASVLSVWIAMPLAMLIGWCVYRKGVKPTAPALISLAVMIGAIVLASESDAFAFRMPGFTIDGFRIDPVITWTAALLVYCYFASTLPVWLLLQPRDYVNAYLLVVGLAMIVLGIGGATFLHEGGAPIVAPAVQADVPGAPPMFPFLFVTIACGAISGFHCLVSSGTSSKQIACETDAQFVGYGSMLTEGFLAVLVILACCAGLGLGSTTIARNLTGSSIRTESEYEFGTFEDPNGTPTRLAVTQNGGNSRLYTTRPEGASAATPREADARIPLMNGSVVFHQSQPAATFQGYPAFRERYRSWTHSGGLARTVSAFVDGAGNFVTTIGVPRPVAVGLMAVLVASFAATTLDTATRLQRYVIQELAATCHIRVFAGPKGATLMAVASAALLAALPPPGQTWQSGMGKGGMTLWPIFGAVNQLLAGLAFTVIVFYLARRRMKLWFILLPGAAMLIIPMTAMWYQMFNTADGWWPMRQFHLIAAGAIIMALQIWMIVEALRMIPHVHGVLEQEPLGMSRALEPVEADNFPARSYQSLRQDGA
ncbi:MAG: carbon starvation protein A [Phycisphaerae bacterium]|nr:carbon starvation protein A [Phycisphaerae bacterium]